MIIGLMQVTASSYSQNTRFRLAEQDIQLVKLFERIENNSEYKFFYNNDEVDVSVEIDVNATNEDVFQVLEKALDGLPYTYKVLDNNLIFVHGKEAGSARSKSSSMQKHTISGVVTDNLGEPLPGVNVFEKSNPTNGVITGVDGSYTIELSGPDVVVAFSFIGFTAQEINVAGRSEIQITLVPEDTDLDEVVVTALGIRRDEKSLGYAVTKVGGEELTTVKSTNFTSALSGRAAGVNIVGNSNLGGSNSVVIRGGSSLTGSNQALFVVDGVPVSNSNVNTRDAVRGGGGYDYGNMAADINPEDIESVSVLKGAAATSLYGSRGANGVIVITTKKGTSKDRIGVNINSTVQFDRINTNTLPQYQNQYGGGYGFGPEVEGADGKMYPTVQYSVDESWGPKFDPNIMVMHWDAYDPSDPDNYLKARPWTAPEHGVEGYFQTGVLWVNNVSLDGSTDKGDFRISYTNTDQKGVMPNEKQEKNTFAFNGTLRLNDRLSTTIAANYTKSYTRNRPGLGYDWQNSTSFMGSAGMWMQTNVDYKRLSNYYRKDNGAQKTWNRIGVDEGQPMYWDNPYWTAYQNYPEDTRNRLNGHWSLNYQITDWLSAMGRVTMDHYDFTVETKIASGSKGTAMYDKWVNIASENNYDFMLNFNKTFDKWNVTGMLGASRRENKNEETGYKTKNGLEIPGLYTIHNSVSPEIEKTDRWSHRRVNSLYGTFSVGYMNRYYLDFALRSDWSSTLPMDNCDYQYPSVSGSYIFSEDLKLPWLSFGKLRANWSQTGNDADFAIIYDKFYNANVFDGTVARYRHDNWKNNETLKAEMAETVEIGIDAKFLNNRVGIDFSYYNKRSKNQIIPATVSIATGYYKQYMNVGEKEDKGIELMLSTTPIKNGDFEWNLDLNYSKNQSKVLELAPGVKDHVLNSNGPAIAIRVNEPYPIITGTDFVYDDNGNKVVGSNGRYLKTSAGQKIGEVAPDWRGGISNRFRYKNWSLSSLIDIKIGGELYSETYAAGQTTGILEETVFTNDLGNPVRDPLTADQSSGGVILEGVTEDGQVNTKRISLPTANASWNNPDAKYIHDASFIKLREVSLNYSVPKTFCERFGIYSLSVSVIGRNLAILHKNVDHFDPELIYGASNVQGLEFGSTPSSRSYGFSVKLGF